MGSRAAIQRLRLKGMSSSQIYTPGKNAEIIRIASLIFGKHNFLKNSAKQVSEFSIKFLYFVKIKTHYKRSMNLFT